MDIGQISLLRKIIHNSKNHRQAQTHINNCCFELKMPLQNDKLATKILKGKFLFS
jgi:hypothetical protein